MGALTASEIVSEGQLLAGRDDNAVAALRWLNRWLRSVAASWSWPQLQREAIGLSLPAGTVGLVVGNGALITPPVQKVLDNIWLYTPDKTFRKRIRIKHQLSEPSDLLSPDSQTGVPSTVRIFSNSHGKWELTFWVIPNKDFYITLPYIESPVDVLTTDVPWYPNDETMVQAVAFKTHEFYDGKEAPATNAAQQLLAGMVTNDRIRFGSVVGINDTLILDPTTFKVR